MKKFLVYLCSIVVAVILGGVIGNLCAGIAPLSWLDYAPPLHLKSHTWNLYVADLTFGIQSKFCLLYTSDAAGTLGCSSRGGAGP